MPEGHTFDGHQMWTLEKARALHDAPFNNLLFLAQTVHRENFDPNKVQLSRLLSIKTGGCPEDCGYCSQSAHHESGLKASKLMEVRRVIAEATKARDAGATRYCMGAAWRNPKARDMDAVVAMVEGVKALGMETCMTLGMLDLEQAARLKQAGLDYYNHNIDTSERYYSEIISTRTFADRLDTLANVRDSGIKVCCGGIVGMGEEPVDRIDMLVTLANLPEHPESVPINMLIPIEGTPLAEAKPIEPIEFVRVIALARIMMPKSHVRLSAGRTAMTDEMQALCFFAGANSIFVGDTLLTADNPGEDKDILLFRRLGMEPMGAMNGALLARYGRSLRGLARKDRLRTLAPRAGLDFSSNDYLGLASCKRLGEAVAAAIARGTPVGATGSATRRNTRRWSRTLRRFSEPIAPCSSAAATSPTSLC
ncbi:biotin synthase [Mesorhizobium japonicum MAFF 303099]|uniref:Biotin synthase n=1 Tax=Mesorhizobium japonicum (strain LMG 29417 / CECT 9101 / MAFF 303099) TaxID=266835 RepID=Q98AG7_RHILO|nr:biotin synthase [Mesorhizobium japonicum MAFF 303099]